MKKKNEKFSKKIFLIFFFFFSIIRGPESGKEKTGSPEFGHLKIYRTSGPDSMSG